MTVKIETFVCSDCGEEFEAVCQAEFEEKKKMHKCKPANKRVALAKELEQQQFERAVQSVVVDGIEAYNFNKLIRQGVIISR